MKLKLKHETLIDQLNSRAEFPFLAPPKLFRTANKRRQMRTGRD